MNCAGFLAKICNVILCIWDGLDAKGSSGTANVIKWVFDMNVIWPIEERWVNKALFRLGTL